LVRVRGKLGKYRIDRRLVEGGYATVYQARDTVSDVAVALKIPHPSQVTKDMLDDFRKEVRMTARLDHPNILPIKDAGIIDGVFYVASPLGIESLADRLARRISSRTVIDFASQMIDAVAYAHRKRVLHCDIKPENFILFADNRIRLADFGIAKVAMRTVQASGSGTVGYIAPEQAMGKVSLRSDVFSLGLVLYRMLAGVLPEWPFAWPPAGHDRLRRRVHPDVIRLLKRALEVDSERRFADGAALARAFGRIRGRAIRRTSTRRGRRTNDGVKWKSLRWQEFSRRFGASLDVHEACHRCGGPTAEVMQGCPWCGARRKASGQPTRFPRRCPRCRRGVKSDWRFCGWCYGAAIHLDGVYRYSDVRYVGRCGNADCADKWIMPFMRYCPWCRRKLARAWPLAGTRDRCPRCRWGVLTDYWDFCPWCARRLTGRG